VEKAAEIDSGTDTAALSFPATGHPTASTFADPPTHAIADEFRRGV